MIPNSSITRFWSKSFFIVPFLFLLLLTQQLNAKNYQKLVKEIVKGMDSTQVVGIAGVPTKTVPVWRWFYQNDEVVITNGEVIDIRLHDHSRKILIRKQDRNNRNQEFRPVSMLRIGMNEADVLSVAGNPDIKIPGLDLYFSNRHRVELTEGKVTQVEMHIKKGLDILDWIRLNFTSGGLLIMNITLAFVMFGVALGIKAEHFKKVVQYPKSAVIGIISQFVALPALTFLLVLIIKPSPSVAMGMILVAACPGGNISNFISSLAKANVALSVSLTAFATLVAIFLTPLNFAIWGKLYSETSSLVIPIEIDAWEMMKTVFILLGIPVIVGLWFSNKFPKTTSLIIKPIKIFSIIAFAGFIVAAFASNFKFFLSYIHLVFAIVLIHNLLAFTTGFSLATLFKLPKADRRTITIETGIQNSGIALVLIFNPNLFNGLGGMAFIAAWWGIWHILAGLTLASVWTRKPLAET